MTVCPRGGALGRKRLQKMVFFCSFLYGISAQIHSGLDDVSYYSPVTLFTSINFVLFCSNTLSLPSKYIFKTPPHFTSPTHMRPGRVGNLNSALSFYPRFQ